MFSFLGNLSSIPVPLRGAIAVALGAVPGALCRYYLTLGLSRCFGNDWPFATFLVNFSGCVLMGIVATLALEPSRIPPDVRLLLAVGFLGSYTTFSTYALELTLLLRSGQWREALLYGFGSGILGVVGIILGSLLAQRLD